MSSSSAVTASLGSALEGPHLPRPVLARPLSVLAWFYLCFLQAQFFLAGLGVFVNPSFIAWHRSLVHAVGWIDFVMLLSAALGRFPKPIVRAALGVVILVGVQYLTIHLRGVLHSVVLGAVHPVSAAMLFVVAWTLARRAHEYAWTRLPAH